MHIRKLHERVAGRAQQRGSGGAVRPVMPTALLTGRGGFDPNRSFGVELFPARTEHFATLRANQQVTGPSEVCLNDGLRSPCTGLNGKLPRKLTSQDLPE